MRLAWFSPMPPVRSGVATCSAELVPALRTSHAIDVFVDEPVVTGGPGLRQSWRDATSAGLRSAHDFVYLHHQQPYDLTVYQIGNSSCHDYIWPYLFRYPGLAVLHDARLHHARAAALLREGRKEAYRAEFAANEPDVLLEAAELAVAGFDSRLHYEWPFTRLLASVSRVTAVHSRAARDTLSDENPSARVEFVRLGHGTPLAPPEVDQRRRAARARLGVDEGAVLFGVFGGITPEKRISRILDALKTVAPYTPSARLLLAGPPAAHYDVRQDISDRGLDSRVIVTGYLETEDELTDAIAACDVTLNLRWPTAREISGPWLRCLAAGRATVIVDLTHTSDLASLDPRTWTSNAPDDTPPITVAVNILDEDHSLRRAMRRLASDAPLREALGQAGRAYWQREHSREVMLEDYRRVLAQAAATPPPEVGLPPHLREDGTGLLVGILGEFGVPVPWSKI